VTVPFALFDVLSSHQDGSATTKGVFLDDRYASLRRPKIAKSVAANAKKIPVAVLTM